MSHGYTPRNVYGIDDLLVACWCEAQIMRVPRRLVLACRTVSCGDRRCTELERTA